MAEMLQERRLFPQSLCLHDQDDQAAVNQHIAKIIDYTLPLSLSSGIVWGIPNCNTHTFFVNKCTSPGPENPVTSDVLLPTGTYTALTIPRFNGTTFTDPFHAKASILRVKNGGEQNHPSQPSDWIIETAVSPEITWEFVFVKPPRNSWCTWKSSDSFGGKFAKKKIQRKSGCNLDMVRAFREISFYLSFYRLIHRNEMSPTQIALFVFRV